MSLLFPTGPGTYPAVRRGPRGGVRVRVRVRFRVRVRVRVAAVAGEEVVVTGGVPLAVTGKGQG